MINSINAADFKNIKDNQITEKLSRKDKSLKSDFDKMVNSNIEKEKTEPSLKSSKTKDKKLWKACKEMESLFVGKMLKEMKKTVHKGELLHGGQAEEIFEDMLYDEYALQVSNNSKVGIASMLYDQLSRK